MKVFSVATNVDPKEAEAFVENMKVLLSDTFGKKHENSICSILDDACYVFVPKTHAVDREMLNDWYLEQAENFGFDNIRDFSRFLQDFPYQKMSQIEKHLRLLADLQADAPSEKLQKITKEADDVLDKFFKKHKLASDTSSNANKIASMLLHYPQLFCSKTVYEILSFKNLYNYDYNQLSEIKIVQSLIRSFNLDPSFDIDEFIYQLKMEDVNEVKNIAKVDKDTATEMIACFSATASALIELKLDYDDYITSALTQSSFYDYLNSLVKDGRLDFIQRFNEQFNALSAMAFGETNTEAFCNNFVDLKTYFNVLFCFLKKDCPNIISIHECLHLISGKLTDDPLGISDSKAFKTGLMTERYAAGQSVVIGETFNEFYTQYLTHKTAEAHNIPLDFESGYDKYLPLFEKFFDKYSPELKEAYLSWNFNSLIKKFGRDNILKVFRATDYLFEVSKDEAPGVVSDVVTLKNSETPLSQRKLLAGLLEGHSCSEPIIKAVEQVQTCLDCLEEHAEQNNKNK